MLMRSDPFSDIDRLTRELLGSSGRRPMLMQMDAYREGDRFVVHFDLPGVDPDSIDLTVEQNVLDVSARREWPQNDNQQVMISERPQGAFSRQIFLGEGLDDQSVEATYENGVLTVTISVSEKAKPRKVKINSGGDTAQAIETSSSES
jgi:HSP20 family protein